MKTTLLRAFALFSAAWLCAGGAKADGVSLSGSGTSVDPYLITNADDWATFSNESNAGTYWTSGTYIKMTQDVIGVNTWVGTGNGTTSANGFKGIFDGGGFTLNVNYTANARACAPFRYIQGATIQNLHVTGTIDIGSYQNGGGIVGIAFDGTNYIQNCWSSVAINTTRETTSTTAGVVAYGYQGTTTIENCLFDGSFEGTSSSANCCGIFAYSNAATVNVRNCCFFSSTFTCSKTNSWTIARTNHGTVNVSDCYDQTSIDLNKNGTDATSIAGTGELCYLLNGDQSNIIWYQTLGDGGDAYPVLDNTHSPVRKVSDSYVNDVDGLPYENGFYQIGTANQLVKFSELVNGGNIGVNGKLTANIIDMDGASWTGMTGFTGTFDGNGKTISNLGAPLCLTTAGGATIQNLTIDGNPIVQAVAAAGFGAFVANHTAGALTLTDCTNRANITSLKGQVGGLVGKVSGQGGTSVELTRCNNHGNISSANGEGNLGGIMGDASCQTVTISDCHNYGKVTMTGKIAQAAGILATHRSAGSTHSSLTVADCHNEGDISGGKNGSGHSNSGGIVGWVAATKDFTRTISIARCYNTGNLQFTGDQFGGIGGNFSKYCTYTITDCYNTGTIEATADEEQGRVCAIVGLFENDITTKARVENCWNSGTITNSSEENKLTSANISTTTVQNCFDTQCSADGVTKVTSEQLASGEVTHKLNGDQSTIVWTQTIGTDEMPVLGTGSSHVYCTYMSGTNSAYANEIVSTVTSMTLTDKADYAADAPFTATSLTYDRPLAKGGYHSLCLPFKVTKTMLGPGSKLFELTEVGTDAVTLNEVEEVAAGTPCFASVTTDFNFGTMSSVAMVASVTNGERLKGTFTEITGDDAKGVYKLDSNGEYFAKTAAVGGDVTDAPVIKPFRSYITEGGGSVKTLNILLSDGTSLTPTLSEEREAVIYDLAGRRVEKATKGLYIINGKKVVK